ncbi:hypothetical protein [Sphingobacterium rhinopitheci]|uniref:hypothetical protein n=1 Tax=Sphingobacterium rhinopitheci TaxID=2781960 RepID=UPI001F51DEAA|nr:hypothetical protein [Sphingobacterium rhinopitheci]MCI0922524.1 hypothetical protein [Sphingobacterium rhinopitheci]
MITEVNSFDKIIKYLEDKKIFVDLFVNDEDDKMFNFRFPREVEDIIFSLKQLDGFASEIETLEYSKKYVRTKCKVQFPIFTDDWLDTSLASVDFKFKNEEYTIEIIQRPLLLAIANVKLGFYSKFAGPLTTYCAIEIRSKKESEIDLEYCQGLVMSFIYEYYQVTNKVLEIVELHNFDADYYKYDHDEDDETKSIIVSTLIQYNKAIDLYLEAAKTADDEICFLYYYKVIEHFSPKIAKLKTYDLLLKKLDTIKYAKITDNDLNNIINISDSLRKSKSDSDLVKTVLSCGIDIVSLFQFLPQTIQMALMKSIKLNPNALNYDLSQDYIDTIIQEIGKWLYSTRNHIVHAKTNYKSNNYECNDEDLKQMNVFLCKATYQIIKWNDNLTI